MALTRPRAYQIYDIDYKQAVRVVTVSNVSLTLGAPNSVDGVNLSVNDRILVTGQSNGAQNGIYYVVTLGTGANGTWARSQDTNTTGELDAGTIVMVTEGVTYADTQWKLTTNDPIVIGTTALTFVLNVQANSISSGSSNVVVNANANVTVSSAGTSNVLIVTSTGTVTSGTANISGNVTGGNLITGGLVSTTGNINTSGALNINSTDGNYNVLNISGTALAPYGTPQTWKFFTNNTALGGAASFILFPDSSTQITAYPGTASALSLSANITGGNLISNAQVTASGNITGGNILTGGKISASGNATVGNISATIGTFTTFTSAQGGTVTGTLVATTANAQFFNQTNGAGYVTVAGYLSAVGNVTGGNLITGGLLTATGNVTGGNLTTAGRVTATANITGGNLVTSGLASVTGNVTGGNILTVGQVSSTGTITTAAGTNSTGFAVGNGAVSNVGLGFFPTAGTRGDYAIRDYSSVFSTIYLDVGMGGSAGGEFQFRSSNAYNLVMRANTTGVYSAGIISGTELTSTQSGVNEGGQINLALPSSGSTLSTSVIIDVYQDRLRFFEGGGTARGAYIDLTSCSAGAATNLLAGGGGGTPGGSNTNVQFNDSGVFGGDGQFTYDKVTNTLTAGIISANNNGNGTNFKVGDDAWIGDINNADTIGLKGQQNPANCYIVFGNSDTTGKLGRAGTGPLTYAGAFTATGNITGGNLSGTSIVGTLTTAAQTNITSVGTLSSLAVTGNVTGGNLITAGLVSASGTVTGSQFNGSGAGLTAIPAANVTGTLSVNTTGYAATVSTAAQPNITSVGTLSSLTVTGNTTSGNFIGTLNGSGANVSSLNADNLASGTVPSARLSGTYTITVSGSATTAGTVTTAAQPNITSVGTLSSLTVTGNTTSGNFIGTLNGSGANVSSLNASNLASGTVPSARLSGTYTITVSGSATTAGTVTTAAQPNITSVGTLSSLTVSGNITGGNLITAGVVTASSLQSNVATGTAPLTVTSTTRVANLNVSYSNVADYISSSTALSGLYYITLINALGANVQPLGNASLTVNAANGALFATSFNGSGAGLTSIPAANVTGTLSVNTTGYAATVSTAAQPNITSVGTLSSLIVSGTFSSGAHTITGSPLTAIVNGGTAGVGNIGASGQGFNTVFAKATSAQYADLAEYYSSDRNYEPGTVVVFGGNAEITQSEQDADNTVAGVVSTNPAYIMNAGIQSAHSVPVALTGRVPTRVIGPVKKGNMMVSTANGYARACATPQIGTVIGKALENFEGDIGIIEVVVGRI